MNVGVRRLKVGFIDENCYVLECGGSVVLVDPGDEWEKILTWLHECRLAPCLMVATHGHLDHTGAIPGLRKAFAEGRGEGDAAIPLAVHSSDARYFGAEGEKTNRELFRAIRASGYFSHFWSPLPEPDILLEDGDAIPGTGFRVIHSPGHSRGSICLYDEAEGILVSGDTLFRDGVGRTDAPDSDPDALDASLRRLMKLPAATRVLPGHGEETTIGRENRHFGFR
jgi:glyoxylase-like metal-dependent hydrolase (beta-lactamase superfamily II)